MDRISTNKLYIDIKLVRFIDMCTLIIRFKIRGHKVSVMITVNFNYMPLFGINSFKIMNKCNKSQQFLITLSSNNLKNNLQNIIEPHNYTRNDSLALFPVHQPEMSNELLRLGSFGRYPSENCPSLIRLAEAGFFYEGHGRKVKCFSCGIMNDDWHSTSVPLDVHRVISPRCKYINERFPQTHSRTFMADISPSFRPSACISKETQSFENRFSIIQEQKATLAIKPEGQSSINRKPLNTSNLNNVPWQTATLSQFKYPYYQNREIRTDTFKKWSNSPLEDTHCMIDAGFFYTDFQDCVRCFSCGIGLRNWEADDNPWVEHARWSPKCPYLLQTKGETFIEHVQFSLGLETVLENEVQTTTNGELATSPGLPLVFGDQSCDVLDSATNIVLQNVLQTSGCGQEMFTIEDVRWRPNVNIHVHNNYNVTGQNIIVGNGTIKDEREIAEESTDMQIRLQMLEKRYGVHYCYIRKFSDMKREASDSEGQRQFDFVCWDGYKIRVSAYIRCRALHFRCQVLASENDFSLQWPFRTRIMFTIVDQKDRTQNITAIDKSKKDIPIFSCPQARDASVYECNQVFPLDDFDSDRYVKGDDVCIMVHIKRQLL